MAPLRIEQFISGGAVDRLPDAVLLVGPDGSILDANRAALDWYGYSHPQMLALSIRDIRSPRDQERIDEQMNEATVRGVLFEAEHRRSDGTLFPVEVRSARVEVDGEDALFSIVRDITSRKRAEDALSASEARFRHMTDAAPVLLWESGTDARCAYFNQPWLDFTGRTLEQEVGDGWAEGLHPDDYQMCLDTYFGAFDERRKFEMEYRLRRADGEYRWLLDHGVPQFTPSGVFAGYIGSCVDITDWKRTQEALLGAHWRIENIIEATHVGMWEWNVQTGETVLNERWAQILGYGLDELVHTREGTWGTLGHPDDRERLRLLVDRHFAGEVPYYDCEYRMRHRDGHWVWVHDRGRVVSRTSEGKPLMMFGTCSDITERRRTEEALRESERRLSLIFENVPDGIVLTTVASGQIVEANEGFCKTSGHAREQVLGKTTDELSVWGNLDERDRFRQLVRRDGAVSDFQTVFRRSSGEFFPGAISSTAVEVGEETCTLSIIRDVTERTRAEDALRETEARFETVFRASPVSISLSRLADGVLLDVNDAFLEIFGLGREDAVGRPVDEVAVRIDPEDRKRVLRELVECGHASSTEVEFRTRSGKSVWLLAVAELVEIAGEPCVLSFAQDIGDLIRARDALRESEAQYRAVVETSPDGFWVTDSEGRILETNDAYARRSGYSREELLGMRIADLDAKHSSDEVAAVVANTAERGSAIFETAHRTKDGAVWPIEVSASYWPTLGGRHFIFVRDIERRKHAELLAEVRADLVEIEQSADVDRLLRAALDRAELLTGSFIGFFHFVSRDQDQLDTQVLSTNTLAVMQVAEGAARHLPISMAGVWAECIKTRGPVIHNCYESLPNRNGLPPDHTPIVRELVVPISRAGKVVAIMGVGNKATDYTQDDIHDIDTVASMVADLALRRKTQDEFEHFFELVPDLVCIISSDGCFHRLNSAWERILGYSQAELLGRPLLELVHPEDLEQATRHFATQLEESVAVAGYANRYRAKDGAYHWLEWNAAPMAGDFSFAAARDVTRRKVDEERLRRYQARLQALAAELVVSAERERGRLGVEIHDGLGQMLTAAKMSAQLLAAEPLEALGKEQAERLVGLLGESISEVRLLTSQLAPTVLFELGLGSALLWLRDRYGQLYDLKCAVRVDEDAKRLRGEDAMFIFRFVREALNNVVRHSRAGQATVTVRRISGCSSAIVSDRGVGFDPALVDEPGEIGGFGLFSIREECLSMGGSMEISSKPGHGTRIRVRVPDDDEVVAP